MKTTDHDSMESYEDDRNKSFMIPANPYAIAYGSTYTIPEAGILDMQDVALLKHMNCSYFSSGRAPTLLALKQHAHSLVNIIRKLAPSTTSGVIGGEDNGQKGNPAFIKNDAFDWLNKLDTPYENDDEAHHLPLWSLANTIKAETENGDILEHHCPLVRIVEDCPPKEKGTTTRPYMTHHSLVQHANECLEILDHEYSATGGLLSILPIEEDIVVDEDKRLTTTQLESARNTLLGQWLLHHQHLVGRMHELEINYANALDLLAGEAQVPSQLLRRIGTEGASNGREVAYPQDKFVLANVGDDVQGYLHRMFDRAEAQIEQKERMWRESGVSGQRMWEENRGRTLYARGLVPIDLLTRFFRIKGKGPQSPIFIIPAVDVHPGVAETRRMEERPTVVSVVTPTWPERVTEWEAKFKKQIEMAAGTDTTNMALVREKLEMKDMLAVKDEELRRNRDQLEFYEKNIGKEVKQRERELLRSVTVYRTKLDELKKALPAEYHSLFELRLFN